MTHRFVYIEEWSTPLKNDDFNKHQNQVDENTEDKNLDEFSFEDDSTEKYLKSCYFGKFV